jgi:hypothetical protein
MSFASLLDHRVYLVRQVPTGSTDDYNQPIVADEIGELFPAAIQPKSAREIALVSQAGAAVGDYTIFMQPRLVSTADRLIHDTVRCPKPDVADLPTLRFNLTGVRNPTGRGHHLSIDASVADSQATGVQGS